MASIFDAQLLMLDDPMLVPRAAEIVREQRVNAEWAIQRVFQEFSAVFDEIADPYLRERKGDVADLVGRLKMNLRPGMATPRDLLRELDEASVLIADELTPSLVAQIDWTRVRGFATDAGSRTYHSAILARSLEVPAVVGLYDASRVIQPGSARRDRRLGERSHRRSRRGSAGARIAASTTIARRPPGPAHERRGPAVTADGVRIRLDANIEFPDDLAAARYAGAEGIGLFRSEFLLTSATPRPPPSAVSSSERRRQYEIYRGMLEGMAPGPVTVRTFDVDEDQLARPLADGWVADAERAGRQGLRGLRLSLARPELFRVQLRALLRAARHGQLRIMFPFVSGVEQIREGAADGGGGRGRTGPCAASRRRACRSA